VSDNRRPVYGVLTEPIRGRIRNKKDSKDSYSHENDEVSYIPKAHVQFLEQSGAVVVPITYTKSRVEIEDELRKVNGIYIAGDSERSIENQ
jgi:peptidase E